MTKEEPVTDTQTEVLDGEAEEVEPEDRHAEAQDRPLPALRPSAEPPGREVLMPADAAQVVAGMQAYQELLPQLLDASDYQEAGRDKRTGERRRFVKKSGWRKIARAFNLSVEILSLRVERDAEGHPTRAECVARAVAPNGQVQDGDGYCAADEKRFRDTDADKLKLENDLRATATTRAKNRAIADLVGMGEVSAEEISDGPAAGATGPGFERASDEEQRAAKRALGAIIGEPEAARSIYAEAIVGFGEVAPAPLCRMLAAVHDARQGG